MVIANPAVWKEKSQKKSQRSIRQRDKLSVTLKSRAKPFSHVREVKSYLAYQPSCKQLQPSGLLSKLPPRQLFYLCSPWGTSHISDSSSRRVLSPLCSSLPISVLWLTVAFCFQTCCWSWKQVPTESDLFNKTHSKLCSPHLTDHLQSSGHMLSFCFPATTGFSTLCYSFEETSVLPTLATRVGKKPSESIQITSPS